MRTTALQVSGHAFLVRMCERALVLGDGGDVGGTAARATPGGVRRRAAHRPRRGGGGGARGYASAAVDRGRGHRRRRRRGRVRPCRRHLPSGDERRLGPAPPRPPRSRGAHDRAGAAPVPGGATGRHPGRTRAHTGGTVVVVPVFAGRAGHRGRRPARRGRRRAAAPAGGVVPRRDPGGILRAGRGRGDHLARHRRLAVADRRRRGAGLRGPSRAR